ncbi:MAG: amidohydrolase family protein, partial [Alphaproteobacteria bacterium]|nr:amidohydrolase family protein [Alphaproteobacteria bacterium]
IGLEEAVRKQTLENAELYGLRDRGAILPGKKADLNVLDFDKLHLHAPYMTNDLPKGGKRLLQRADGYRATVAAGQIIAEAGEMTDARPGRLVRGPQG